MEKLLNYRIYIVLVIIIICVGLALLLRSSFDKKEVLAYVSPFEMEIGGYLTYRDSTINATQWLWEFGNGDSSDARNGEYRYTETGKYQIRLTVDGQFQKKFIVNIKPKPVEVTEEQQFVTIIAPDEAFEGEMIAFRAEGEDKEWRWEFGENPGIDSREQTAIYKYEKAGVYEVMLSTENTNYPVRHMITIKPSQMVVDSIDKSLVIAVDIKERLQAIIDQKPFNYNYNYILENYLCGQSKTMVVINNIKRNDFYSYCQGLRLIGKDKTSIEEVFVELDPRSEECVQKIYVLQSDNN